MTSENEDLAPLYVDDTNILNELIFLKDAAKLTSFTAEYLKTLAYKGRLQAVKKGRDYQTTRAWIIEYINSRHQGRKNK